MFTKLWPTLCVAALLLSACQTTTPAPTSAVPPTPYVVPLLPATSTTPPSSATTLPPAETSVPSPSDAPTEPPAEPPAAPPTEQPTEQPTEPPAQPPAQPPAAPPANVADWPAEVARLINEARAANGLPPMTYNDLLAAAAQGQANDCAARGYCSHRGSDDSDSRTRIARAGYVASATNECWAMNPTPQDTVAMWLDEVPPDDPHRRALLSTTLTEVGVGIAPASYGYFFLADFGTP